MRYFPNIPVLVSLLLMYTVSVGPVHAEFKAYWYVLYDTETQEYSDYYGGTDPHTYQGNLPEHIYIENIFECVIKGNTGGIPEEKVKEIVREQFRKETFRVYAKYDPPNNPYLKIAQYDSLVNFCSRFYDLNRNYVLAIILKESGANANMTGPNGEMGLLQIRPEMARRIIAEKGLKDFPVERMYEPAWNIAFGCYYFYQLTEEFGRDVDNIIAAYYTSPEDVKRYVGREQPDEVKTYVNRVKYLAYIFDSFPQPKDHARSVWR